MVFERVPDHSIPCVFATIATLWLSISSLSWSRDVGLDHGSSILDDDLALDQCDCCVIKFEYMQTTLVIFSGLPGTGKSILADKLARKLRWPLLRIDDVIGDVPEDPGIAFWDSKVDILLDLVNTQLDLGLDVIVDSVFMNMDRHHTQELAHKYGIRFLPIYVFVSDEKIWEERVTARYHEMNNKDVATWERIQHQREHFREWEPDTALFIDSVNPLDENFAKVFDFVTKENIVLKPLSEIQLSQGKYHR